ncbi:hypothetical protein ACPJXG_28245 [Janthinobacterium sp. NFX145]|uniref:hypothetical protein n=1 Tax=Janthinobacterium sp. NFX145 TaxID=3415602 RepID=UPI003CC6BE4E
MANLDFWIFGKQACGIHLVVFDYKAIKEDNGHRPALGVIYALRIWLSLVINDSVALIGDYFCDEPVDFFPF